MRKKVFILTIGLMLTINLTLLTTAVMAQTPVNLSEAREMYYGMSVDECNALKLAELFNKKEPTDPLLKAYYGAASAAAPTCVTNPARKISYFRKGTRLMDDAVKDAPGNFEVRFLRFATQEKAPGFLGYKGDLENDKNFLIKNLASGFNKINDQKVLNFVSNFLIGSKNLNQKEKLIVKEFLKTLK